MFAVCLDEFLTSIFLCCFTLQQVYKSPASDTYVIFGEAKIEDINAVNSHVHACSLR